MEHPLVAIIDRFEPSIIKKIQSVMPDKWRYLAISEDTKEARLKVLGNANIALLMGAKLDDRLLKLAPKLKFIQKMGAGVDNIDIQYCKNNKIGVARLNAGNNIPVAEHTIMMMLAITRGLMHLDNRTRKGEWDKELARGNSKQIYRKTVGIIGLGAIGRQVAKLLRAFDTDIVYCDPIPAPASLEKKLKLQRVSLNNLLTISDIVTLHLPKNKKTSLLIDKDKISIMKKDAILINCARGGLVDEFALSQALRNGRLFGAGIDTFSTEPPENNPLISLENVILTPHCAGATLDNFSFIAERAIENCSSFISNTALPELDVVHDPRNIDF